LGEGPWIKPGRGGGDGSTNPSSDTKFKNHVGREADPKLFDDFGGGRGAEDKKKFNQEHLLYDKKPSQVSCGKGKGCPRSWRQKEHGGKEAEKCSQEKRELLCRAGGGGKWEQAKQTRGKKSLALFW